MSVVVVPTRTENTTRATPTLSAALAVTGTVPLTVAAAAGAVTATPVGATTSGAVAPRSMRAYRPPFSALMPAVRYSVVTGWLRAPLPNVRPHSPSLTMALPVESFTEWMNAPVLMSKPLILPSPKLPTSSAPLSVPKLAGATAMPQGALSAPPTGTRCLSNVPLTSKVLTRPRPAPGIFVTGGRVLLGIGHHQHGAACDLHGLDVEGRVAGRQRRIRESAAGRHLGEGRVEYLDLVVVEIRRVEKVGAAIGGDGQALVDGATGGIVIGIDRVRGIHRGRPPGDRAALGGEDEPARQRSSCHWSP